MLVTIQIEHSTLAKYITHQAFKAEPRHSKLTGFVTPTPPNSANFAKPPAGGHTDGSSGLPLQRFSLHLSPSLESFSAGFAIYHQLP